MRVAVIGAGSVGRSIARELLNAGHHVLLIDKDTSIDDTSAVADAEWILGDACEMSTLTGAHLESCEHVVCATGDDKVNLVVSFLAKTEFAVPRTVARVNNPRNEWLFNDSWGVDVLVSTPRLMTALVEGAVAVGDLVRLFEFQEGKTHLVEFRLPADSPHIGHRVGSLTLGDDVQLVTILRDGQAIIPRPDEALEGGDDLLLMCPPQAEHRLALLLNPATGHQEVRAPH